ncbi:MAG: hypothetical protein ACJ79J_07445 [Gemmatimonadaceae bacterium]|jgi:hypothetical protein
MARSSRFWRIAAAAYFFINAAGAVYAIVVGEPMHAFAHVALLVVGAGVYGLLRLNSSPAERETLAAGEANERIDHLEQSLNSIALNVERIGEAQRFEKKVLEERMETSPTKTEN